VAPQRHTDREFEQELTSLREHLLRMSGRVEQMIADSIQALIEDDADLARRTIQCDRRVNQDEVDADDHCMRLLARWQPMASDLRFILFSHKVVTDLERIGDLAVNVCERVLDLHGARPAGALIQLPEMGRLVQGMLRDAMDAFLRRDTDAARAVMDSDDRVDELYHAVFREELRRMCSRENVDDAETYVRMQNIAKYLERIGDHATNLAEQVIFLVRGQDVRHEGKRP